MITILSALALGVLVEPMLIQSDTTALPLPVSGEVLFSPLRPVALRFRYASVLEEAPFLASREWSGTSMELGLQGSFFSQDPFSGLLVEATFLQERGTRFVCTVLDTVNMCVERKMEGASNNRFTTGAGYGHTWRIVPGFGVLVQALLGWKSPTTSLEKNPWSGRLGIGVQLGDSLFSGG